MNKTEDNIAIRVSRVYKSFKLPHHNRPSSIKSVFINPFTVTNKSKSEQQHALKNISFDVKKGEFFGIVGRNGSGKSTLLKILAGIYQPNKGSVVINGRLVPFIELGVGFNPELTGRENVYLSGALMGFSIKDVDEKYDIIVDFAELERFMDQKLKNYSSGMQVRLAFSVATQLVDSDILLIDEVLAVGDADFQRKCFNYFKKLKKDKKTVVFVSHDMSAIREYCEKAVLVDGGNIISSGNAEDVSREYSRLFNTGRQDKNKGQEKRWGNKKATITSVNLSLESLNNKHQDQKIFVTVHFKKGLNNPIVGFSIKNASGQIVVGTNNKLQNVSMGSVVTGSNREVVFTIPNIFSDGQYHVDIAILEEDALSICDWWEDALRFTSFEDDKSIAISSPLIHISLKG